MATTQPRFPIVGLGASAGGIEALQHFLRVLPPDTGMAFIVVTHLAFGRDSPLDEILKRSSALPVVTVEDGGMVEPNRLYVMTKDPALTIRSGRLHLHRAEPGQHERHPIDVFFASLAQDQGEYAIGIVLSGGGSDGTLGIKAIKENGGLTLAQGTDHTAPRHPSMPASAIASGLVDLVLPVEDMPAKLVDYVRGFAAVDDLTAADRKGNKEQAAQTRLAICAILRDQLGHDFSGYKERTFLRRVQRRMQVLQITKVNAYVERLRRDSDEARLLFRDLLIGVTNFFRDRDAFEALERLVLPRLFENKGADDSVRVWVPGCATGEEVFSIAILLREHMDTLTAVPRVQLFATDIDEGALAIARAGRYPANLLDSVTPERLQRFFVGDGTSYLLSKEIRDLCIFSSHSVIRDPPFSRIDLISCRNLLIYLDTEVQNRVVPIFHYALRRGGYLFLGSSENVTQHADLFAPIDRKHRIFQRRDHAQAPLNLPQFLYGGPSSSGRAGTDPRLKAGAVLPLRHIIDERVMERFAPAHVVVDRDGDVVYYSARTGRYLEPPAGAPNRQVVGLARKGLRQELRAALREAIETRHVVTRAQVPVEIEDRIQFITLVIEPLSHHDSDPLFLVLFDDAGLPVTHEEAARNRPLTDDASMAQVERELRETRERLQSLVEEYETALEELKSANEELVSVNEEMQSSNEELETSKEELQSLNEELQTVNAELNSKVEELDRVNADLKNLFESTEIATIFLDRNLVIRSYTPAVTAIFNLIPSDRGRPLTDIASRLELSDLRRDIQTVLDSRAPLERRVRRQDGETHYLMRVLPYRMTDNRIDGVLVTFVDITAIAADTQRRRIAGEMNQRVRDTLRRVAELVAGLVDGGAQSPVAEAVNARLGMLASAYDLLARGNWEAVPLAELIREVMAPFAPDGAARISLDGAAIAATPRATLALAMVLHELAAEAAQSGALAAPDGRIEIAWSLQGGTGEGRRFNLRWQERGGPPARSPENGDAGFDRVQRIAREELRGSLQMAAAADGRRAALDMPFASELLRLDGAAVP